MKIIYMILNMKESINRMKNIEKIFKELDEKYIRIEGINGKNMKDDKICEKIYKKKLIGYKMNSYEYKQEWEYDGTIEKSFPGLNLNGHYGYKGLILSNMKAFFESIKYSFDWLIILEDDIDLIKIELLQIKNNLLNNSNNIVLLDERGNGYGGACGIAYRKNIIDKIIKEFDPLSEFSINYEKKFKKASLNDWKLYDLLKYYNISYNTFPIIRSGYYDSTISNNIKKNKYIRNDNMNIFEILKSKLFNSICITLLNI